MSRTSNTSQPLIDRASAGNRDNFGVPALERLAQDNAPVRSFVRRQGRITPGQQRAFDQHWLRYGIDTPVSTLDRSTIFGRKAALVVEIGFGNGETLLAQARANPDCDFLGIEVHRPGVGHLLMQVAALEVTNVRVICDDAVAVIERCLAIGSVQRLQIFFPDPWPKKRHHKRRLIQPVVVDLLASCLTNGGQLHLATDWEHYARQMLQVLGAAPGLENMAPGNGFATATGRLETKFERRGKRRGHAVWDLQFQRVERQQGENR